MTAPVKKQSCPICEYELENTTGIGSENKDAIPNPGDICVCLSCGGVLRFNDNIELTTATEDELIRLPFKVLVQLLVASDHIRNEKPLKNEKYGQ